MKWFLSLVVFATSVAIVAGVLMPRFRPQRTDAMAELEGQYFPTFPGANIYDERPISLSISSDRSLGYSPSDQVHLKGTASISSGYLQVDIPDVYLGDVQWDRAKHVIEFEYPTGQKNTFYRHPF